MSDEHQWRRYGDGFYFEEVNHPVARALLHSLINLVVVAVDIHDEWGVTLTMSDGRRVEFSGLWYNTSEAGLGVRPVALEEDELDPR